MSAMNALVGSAAACDLIPSSRSPLERLLHALNQPLTGLHCSLELALVGQRTPEQYVDAMREGLELAGRMSVLVAAIREVVDIKEEHHYPGPERERQQNQAGGGNSEVIALDGLLREAVSELQPVAEAKPGHIFLHCAEPLPVRAACPRLTSAVFRLLDSALSLATPGAALQITACRESRHACLQVRWEPGTYPPKPADFSRPELGLLIAEAAWEHLGGNWSRFRSRSGSPEKTGGLETVLARLPLALTGNECTTESLGGSR
jgi:hypothetical protein